MPAIDRRLLGNFDWVMFALALLITLIGIVTIYSATRPLTPGAVRPDYYMRQLYWLAVAVLAMLAVISVPYYLFDKFAYVFYGAGFVLLVAVLVAGRTGMGAKRWIALGPVSFQPSEIFKIAFLVVIARELSNIRGAIGTKRVVRLFLIFAMLPILLILKQPDLGSALVVMILYIALMLTKGVSKRFVTIAVIIAALSIPFVGTIVWDGLKPYQKKRIVVFINPEADPEGLSYHIQQSKVAIGSGQVLGKGYLKGTQGPFRFLPEKHTDFIFAVFSEEWGFVGSFVLIVLYLLFILRGIDTAMNAKDEFGRLLAFGLTFTITLYCIINMSMTMGLAPVVGIPLPFMSYGGTALVSNFIIVGMLINIRARRFELFY